MASLKEQLVTLANNYTACDVRILFPRSLINLRNALY